MRRSVGFRKPGQTDAKKKFWFVAFWYCVDTVMPGLICALICYLPTALEKHMQTQKKSQASEFRKLC